MADSIPSTLIIWCPSSEILAQLVSGMSRTTDLPLLWPRWESVVVLLFISLLTISAENCYSQAFGGQKKVFKLSFKQTCIHASLLHKVPCKLQNPIHSHLAMTHKVCDIVFRSPAQMFLHESIQTLLPQVLRIDSWIVELLWGSECHKPITTVSNWD